MKKLAEKSFLFNLRTFLVIGPALGLCGRCYTYNKCLGLASLSKEEWQAYENSSTKILVNLDLDRIASCENNS